MTFAVAVMNEMLWAAGPVTDRFLQLRVRNKSGARALEDHSHYEYELQNSLRLVLSGSLLSIQREEAPMSANT